jgi:hypothetical protein
MNTATTASRHLAGQELAEAQQNLRRCFELSRVGRQLAIAGLKHDHPEASDRDLRQMFQRLLEQRRQGKWQS